MNRIDWCGSRRRRRSWLSCGSAGKRRGSGKRGVREAQAKLRGTPTPRPGRWVNRRGIATRPLTTTEIAHVNELHEAGWLYVDIARACGCRPSKISRCLLRKEGMTAKAIRLLSRISGPRPESDGAGSRYLTEVEVSAIRTIPKSDLGKRGLLSVRLRRALARQLRIREEEISALLEMTGNN